MPNVKATTLVLALSAALLVSGLSRSATAQEAYDPEDTVYATGAIFETEDELADKPRTPLFRAYLPPSVDLRDRFPPAGDQGEQGSCVGWAVGYAARSYYNSQAGGGSRLTAGEIPSPAYIYDSIRSPGRSCDSGTRIMDALNLLKKGAVAYAEYPYDVNRCRRPSTGLAARASKFRIAEWLVVDTDRLDQVKGELAGGHPGCNRLVAQQGLSSIEGAQGLARGPAGKIPGRSCSHRRRVLRTGTVLHGDQLMGPEVG